MEWLKALVPFGIAVYFINDGLYLVGVIFIVAAVIALLQTYQQRQKTLDTSSGADVQSPDMTISLEPDLEDAIKTMVEAGNKLEAIKEVRRLSGAGLKASKDYVESL